MREVNITWHVHSYHSFELLSAISSFSWAYMPVNICLVMLSFFSFARVSLHNLCGWSLASFKKYPKMGPGGLGKFPFTFSTT
jgi:hypothetical protein